LTSICGYADRSDRNSARMRFNYKEKH